VIGRNELQRDDSGRIRAVDTGERETIDCGLVLRSIGYKGIPIDGVPFDDGSGLIHNEAGRVHDGEGNQVEGLYAVGWIKRGPSGVIGTNKKDGQETVDQLFADLEAGKIPEPELAGDRDAIESLLNERKPDHVTFERWQALDSAEVERGKPHGRPRVKFCTFEELVEASKAAKTAA
jgi:ferredoxin--NADP+ reductase